MNSQKSHLPFRVLKIVWACAVVTLACVACHKDDDVAPAAVVGYWKGAQALIQVQLDGTALPYEVTDDDFNPEIEFKSDGTVRMEQDGDTYNGNYSLSGNTLTLASIRLRTSFVDLSGTYTVQEANNSVLVLYTEKADVTTNPQTGAPITGKVKATLRFRKIMG